MRRSSKGKSVTRKSRFPDGADSKNNVETVHEMKNPNRETVSQLDELPNIGKSIADNLRLIGIDHPKKLVGKEPFALYEALCKASGNRQDPCVIDVFMSVIHFMEGGDPLPWWSFTRERKRRMAKR